MLHRGLKKGKVLLFNLLSALTAFAGAILTFFIAQTIQGLLPVLLSLTAGFFIYIAASDLIPEIHQERRKGFAFFESVLLLLGVVVVWVFVSILG
ncbi:MAG: ZIP family metal transporter [Candidatus Levybacteria bacterium]|nr:ZIP family metal transporter [Candidatus Levybacteria bacterium]